MSRYEYIGNKRKKEHGLLVCIRKDILTYCKRKNIEKEDFAHIIGLASWGSLENKLKRTKDDTDITVTELIHISEITGSHNPLKYLNEMFGFIMTSSESINKVSVEEVNRLADEAQIECSESFSETKRAGQDGMYTVEEKESMIKESMESLEATKKHLSALKQIVPVDLELYEG